ncbi:hypothetical protein STEG23_014950, partial [Scotinomys teguina]
FVYMVEYIDRFSYVEPSPHLLDEAHLIIVDDRFDVFLDLVCKYFIEYFCINFGSGFIYLVDYSKNQLFVLLILCIVLCSCVSEFSPEFDSLQSAPLGRMIVCSNVQQ